MNERYEQLSKLAIKGDVDALRELFDLAEQYQGNMFFPEATVAFREVAIAYRISAFRNLVQAEDAERRVQSLSTIQDMDFQKEFVTQAQLTERMTKALLAADVLEDAGISIRPEQSEKALNVQGFMVVNERKLKALKIDPLEKLHRADALGLAYAQLLSMKNISHVVAGSLK